MISIIFDTETTGLLSPSVSDIKKQPKTIEFGAIKIKSSKKIDSISQLIDPEEPLTPTTTKITGIANKDITGMPTFKKFIPKLIKFVKGCDIMIAHNADFDVNMLKNELARAKCDNFPWPDEIICTASEYVSVLGFYPRVIDIYEYIMGKPLTPKHRALDDCEALYEILIKDNFFKTLGG